MRHPTERSISQASFHNASTSMEMHNWTTTSARGTNELTDLPECLRAGPPVRRNTVPKPAYRVHEAEGDHEVKRRLYQRARTTPPAPPKRQESESLTGRRDIQAAKLSHSLLWETQKDSGATVQQRPATQLSHRPGPLRKAHKNPVSKAVVPYAQQTHRSLAVVQQQQQRQQVRSPRTSQSLFPGYIQQQKRRQSTQVPTYTSQIPPPFTKVLQKPVFVGNKFVNGTMMDRRHTPYGVQPTAALTPLRSPNPLPRPAYRQMQVMTRNWRPATHVPQSGARAFVGRFRLEAGARRFVAEVYEEPRTVGGVNRKRVF